MIVISPTTTVIPFSSSPSPPIPPLAYATRMIVIQPTTTVIEFGPPPPYPPGFEGDINFTDDLDKGSGYTAMEASLGPTIGRAVEQILPSYLITRNGTYRVVSASVILVNCSEGPVTIRLPSVRTWVRQPFHRNRTGIGKSIWIKDIGGFAENVTNRITVMAVHMQMIDDIMDTFIFTENFQMVKFHPLPDLSGWFIA